MNFVFSLFLFFLKASEFDSYGVLYEDSTFRRVILAPSNLQNYSFPVSVASIAGGSAEKSAFYQCKSIIKNVTFPIGSQLESLDSYAFYGCSFNSVIDLSNCIKLKALSYASFCGCSSMKNIILPPNIVEIESAALAYCSSITSIEFPASLETLGGYTSLGASLLGCSRLEHIIWTNNSSLKTFGSNCLCDTNLSEIFIPKLTESIHSGAFLRSPITKITIDTENKNFFTDKKAIFSNDGCNLIYFAMGIKGTYMINNNIVTLLPQSFASSLLSIVNISSSVKNINYQVFWASKITQIIIPSTVTSFQNSIFSRCTLLESIKFDPNIQSLPEYTFYECTNLNEVIVPGSVKTIGVGVFQNCCKLMHIFLPKSVESIDGSCFTGIHKDCYIEFEKDSKMFVENETLFSENMNDIIAYIGSSSNFDLIIPKSVITIKSSAYKNIKLRSLCFEEHSKLTKIEDTAFEGSGLTSIKLPPELLSLGTGCFISIPTLSKIDFSESTKLTSIGESSFKGCSIKSLKLPPSLEEVLKYSFMNCAELSSVTFSGNSLKKLDAQCFFGTSIDEVMIPSTVKQTGSQIFGESLTSVTFLPSATTAKTELESIGDSSFKNCYNLHNVKFVDGIKTIGRNSFEGCRSIEIIKLCESIETISLQSFKGCTGLERVGIPDESKLKNIEGFAFEGCLNLAEFDITENNQNFKADEGALYNHDVTRIVLYLPGSKRKNYTTPNTIEKIDAYSFHSATNIEVIDMRDSPITIIGNSAFYGCSRLRLVYLSDVLKRVDGLAFAECTSLVCGSIVFEYNETLYQMLASGSAPIESLSPCSTVAFTINNDTNLMNFVEVSLIEKISIFEGD